MTVNTVPVENAGAVSEQPATLPDDTCKLTKVGDQIGFVSGDGRVWLATLPDDAREVSRVGDHMEIVCGDGRVAIMSPVVYAMCILQEKMKGEFEKAGLYSDDDVVEFMKEIRREVAAERMAAAERDQAPQTDGAPLGRATYPPGLMPPENPMPNGFKVHEFAPSLDAQAGEDLAAFLRDFKG